MLKPVDNYDKMTNEEKENLLLSGKQILRLYVPNFCSGIPLEAYYFDNIEEVFDLFRGKYKNFNEEYKPVVCEESYFDSKIICMQGEYDRFVAGFLYNY